MSARRRRSETSWEDKDEKMPPAEIHSKVSRGSSQKWSNSEVNDGNYSRRPSWDPLQGNRNGPRDDDISRDRHRMQTDPTFDEWEKQYSTRPSDDSYGPPYRSRDRGVVGSVHMSRDQTRSPYQSRSRSRSRSRGGARGVSRSRSRSPLYDDRHESNQYPDIRNNARVSSGPRKDFASRGGLDNNLKESWSRRPDYKGGSRYNDYPHRNVYDDEDHRRQPNRNTRVPFPCRFFAAGNCNRDDCKFSHEAAAGGYDGRSRDHNSGNKKRTWQNDLNANSNFGEKNKSWNGGPSWDDVESGGYDNNIQGHTSDDKKKLWDGPSHDNVDSSYFHDVGKSNSNPNLDNKKSSWNGPTSWDGVSGPGFSNVSNPHCHNSEESAKKYARGTMSEKSGNNIDGNRTRKKWDGPLWDEEVSEPVIDNDKIRKWDGSGLNKMASDNVVIVVNNSDLNNIVSEDANQQILTSEKDSIQSVHDMNSQPVSYSNGSEHMRLSNLLNGPVQGMSVHMENQNKESGKAMNDVNETSLTRQVNSLPAEMSQRGQLPQLYTDLNLTNAIDFLKSLPDSASNQDTRAKEEEQNSARNMEVKPMGTLSGSVTQKEPVVNPQGIDNRVGENGKKKEENKNPDNFEPQGKVEENDINGNEEKALRLFKVALVEFVKEILKPKWKEGKMSREVHKTVVKKVVEKVTSSIHGIQIPRTQTKIDQYLTCSKPKITKLVEAYVERLLKA